MGIFRRLKIAQPVSDRQPDKASLLIWAQREVVLVLKQLRRVVNWAVDWLGYVGIDITDTPGLLDDKLLVDSTMTKVKGGPEGARTLTLGADAAGVVNIITTNPTLITSITQTIVSDPTNVTIINQAQPTPATVSGRLYPAEVEDPLRRPPIRGVFSYSEGSTFLGAMVPVAGTMDTLVATDSTLLLTFRGSGTDQVPAVAGDLGLMWENSGTGNAGYWVYEVVDPGGYRFAGGFACIRRALSSNTSASVCVGAFCQVTGGPELEYNGEFFRITSAGTLGTAPIVIEELTTNPATATFDLLGTGPQCTSLGAGTDVRYSTILITAGPAVPLWGEVYFHTIGLNRTTLPAGLYSVTAKVSVSGGDVGATVALIAAMLIRHADNSFDSAFTTFGGPPLRVGDYVITWQGLHSTDVTCLTTDELALQLKADTNSATPISITVTWQAPGRPTFLDVPFKLADTGVATGRHPDLSQRNAPLQHPDSSCYPVIGDSTGAGSQWLWPSNGEPFGDRCSFRRYSLTDNGAFQGIAKSWADGTPIPDGFEYRVFIPSASPVNLVTVLNAAPPPDGSPYLPFSLPATNGVVHPLTLSGPTMLWFWLDLSAGCWRFDHAVTY